MVAALASPWFERWELEASPLAPWFPRRGSCEVWRAIRSFHTPDGIGAGRLTLEGEETGPPVPKLQNQITFKVAYPGDISRVYPVRIGSMT